MEGGNIISNPFRVMRCPVCRGGVKVGRGITKLTCPECGARLMVPSRHRQKSKSKYDHWR